MTFVPITQMVDRVEQDGTDSDIARFYSLLFLGEVVTKAVVLGTAAGIEDDRDRRRYAIHHRLVRSDGLGDWCSALDEILTGPPSQHLRVAMRETQRQLTQRNTPDHWGHRAVAQLNRALVRLQINAPQLGERVALRQWFPMFANLRNKTRGHGAPRGADCSSASEAIEESISLIANNLALFQLPWAQLHRNLSGKYRVSALSTLSNEFTALKSTSSVNLPNGIYIDLGSLCPVELMECDVDLRDFFFANGSFDGASYESLSYLSNERRRCRADRFMLPATALPESETQGHGRLDATGTAWTNLPSRPKGYIERHALQALLLEQLEIDRHPIVTLTGPGGIGKTSLALEVLHNLTESPSGRFDVVVWLSARDIDLLPSGPKAVKPRVLSHKDFATEFARLLEPGERFDKGFDPVMYLARALGEGPTGPTLFVLDNFETVAHPADFFKWIDTYVRPPNKVLITTRIRDFAGDFPVEVRGMTDAEAESLIASVSASLGIAGFLKTDYKSALIRESDGHPYVMKILLGEVAKTGKAVRPERLVAGQDEILTALFERSYAALTPAAQRVFLLLASWRSVVPEVALEAVVLRSENERTDVRAALEELRRMSLVDEIRSEMDGQFFVGVPLAAALFGRRKLSASPLRVVVDADSQLLQSFGAGRKEDVKHGVMPRVRRLLKRMAEAEDPATARVSLLPILTFLASRVPAVWLELANYDREAGNREEAVVALRRFLEKPDSSAEVPRAWRMLADLCRSTGDYAGEIHALAEMCDAEGVGTEVISSAANRLNGLFVELNRKGQSPIDRDERRLVVERIAGRLEERLEELDATDCSRLAWLHVNLKNSARGLAVVERGLTLDPTNSYCRSLADRLQKHG